MRRLEVSGVVRLIYRSLGVKGLRMHMDHKTGFMAGDGDEEIS